MKIIVKKDGNERIVSITDARIMYLKLKLKKERHGLSEEEGENHHWLWSLFGERKRVYSKPPISEYGKRCLRKIYDGEPDWMEHEFKEEV